MRTGIVEKITSTPRVAERATDEKPSRNDFASRMLNEAAMIDEI